MKKNTLFLFLFCSLVALAQDTIVKKEILPPVVLKNGVKCIYVQRLGLSPNMSINEVLLLFNEVSSAAVLSDIGDFSVEVDGKSVGDAREVAMSQMDVSEVERIEIEEYPSANSAGGGSPKTIKIYTIQIGDGLSGNAKGDVSNNPNVLVSSNVNYKMPKVAFLVSFKAQIKNNINESTSNTYDKDIHTFQKGYYDQGDTKLETFKLEVRYNPKERHYFKFWAWETFNAGKSEEEVQTKAYLSDQVHFDFSTQSKKVDLKKLYTFFGAQYTFQINKNNKISFDANYSFNQYDTVNKNGMYGFTFVDSIYGNLWTLDRPSTLNGEISYNAQLLKNEKHALDLQLTSKTYIKKTTTLSLMHHEQNDITLYTDSFKTENFDLRYTTSAELIYHYDVKLRLALGAAYSMRFFNYKYEKEPTIDTLLNNWRVTFLLNYSFNKNQSLQYNFVRNWLSPSLAGQKGYALLNDLSYVFMKQIDDHLINTNLTGRLTYNNFLSSENTLLVGGQAAAFWRYKWAAFSLTGNYWRPSVTAEDSKTSFYNYFSLRATPLFYLPKQWTFVATFTYDSKQKTPTFSMSDYFSMSFRIAKQIGKWSVHTEIDNPINYTITDIYKNGTTTEKVEGYKYKSIINLGILYSF